MNFNNYFFTLIFLCTSANIATMENAIYSNPSFQQEDTGRFILYSKEGNTFYIERHVGNLSETLKRIANEYIYQSYEYLVNKNSPLSIDTKATVKRYPDITLQKVITLLNSVFENNRLNSIPSLLSLVKVSNSYEFMDFIRLSLDLKLDWAEIFNRIEQNNPSLLLELINNENRACTTINIISSDQISFTIPFNIARYLKNFEFEFTNTSKCVIHSNLISGSTFKTIINCIEIFDRQIRYQKLLDGITGLNRQIQYKNHYVLNNSTCIMYSIDILLKTTLESHSLDQLTQLINAAQFIGLPWLARPALATWTRKQIAIGNSTLEEVMMCATVFPSELHPLIQELYCLQIRQCKDIKLTDYFALFGKPVIKTKDEYSNFFTTLRYFIEKN